MTMGNKFYLSTFLGTEHAMGNMLILLSDTTLTRGDSGIFRHALEEGDIVLCECERRGGGTVYTVAMAKVEQFAQDGKTPVRLRCLWGRDISLIGEEEIIDHRKGHLPDCQCGAPPKKSITV